MPADRETESPFLPPLSFLHVYIHVTYTHTQMNTGYMSPGSSTIGYLTIQETIVSESESDGKEGKAIKQEPEGGGGGSIFKKTQRRPVAKNISSICPGHICIHKSHI